MTAVSHFPRIDLTGMAVMALMNARINRRWETRERRRWMCLKVGFLAVLNSAKNLDFIFGIHLFAWKGLTMFIQTNMHLHAHLLCALNIDHLSTSTSMSMCFYLWYLVLLTASVRVQGHCAVTMDVEDEGKNTLSCPSMLKDKCYSL